MINRLIDNENASQNNAIQVKLYLYGTFFKKKQTNTICINIKHKNKQEHYKVNAHATIEIISQPDTTQSTLLELDFKCCLKQSAHSADLMGGVGAGC